MDGYGLVEFEFLQGGHEQVHEQDLSDGSVVFG